MYSGPLDTKDTTAEFILSPKCYLVGSFTVWYLLSYMKMMYVAVMC